MSSPSVPPSIGRITYFLLKRLIDIFFSIMAIIILSPVMIAVSLVIKINSAGPVIYKGARVGKYGEMFSIYKFRTMIDDAEQKGGFSTSIDDARLTKSGRFLRKYKIDELPQFFNVLFGRMSLVGPRPQVKYYTDKYSEIEMLILAMRPGITDLASLYFSDMDSVLGSIDVDSKYECEIEPIKNILRIRYVQKSSILLDLRILIETFFKLLGFRNITKLNVEP